MEVPMKGTNSECLSNGPPNNGHDLDKLEQ